MATGEGLSAILRVRMSSHDAHYGGGLVDGARMLALFGDVATELLIRMDGDEGLFASYDSVEFVAPVYAGDYIEAQGRIVKSRQDVAARWSSKRAKSSPRAPKSARAPPTSSIRRSSFAARPAPASLLKRSNESSVGDR